MAFLYKRFSISLLVASLLVTLLFSCNKFDGDQEIPAYIKIDTITFKHNSVYPEGSLSVDIANATVYVDDQFIGMFQLPAMIPVLAEGECKVQINPGVILNGMYSTRAYYPFYEPIIFESIELTPGSEVTELTNLVTEYRASTIIAWEENFEDPYYNLDTAGMNSTTDFILTETGSDETFYGNHSGKVLLTSTNNYFRAQTKDRFTSLPDQSQPVFLELNYRGTNQFISGVQTLIYNVLDDEDVLVTLPKENWKKLYIYLSPTISYYPESASDALYFYTTLDSNIDEGYFILDNIRLIYQDDE